MSAMRLAVMDLGSSSFQLLVADVGPGPTILPVRRTREVLNLGLASSRSSKIPTDLLREALSRLRSFRRLAASSGAEQVIAVATSALREAEDRHGLATTLGEAAGVTIRFLSGDEEAELMYAGIRGSVGSGSILALDLGGGSLEVAVGEGSSPDAVTSAPLGAARLTGGFGGIERLNEADRQFAEDSITSALEDPRLGSLLRRSVDMVAACGGTVRTLTRIAGPEAAPRAHAPGSVLRRRDLETLTSRLWEMSLTERRAVPGIAKRRAALLPAGALVLLRTIEHSGQDDLVVSGWGLREGCLLEAARAFAA